MKRFSHPNIVKVIAAEQRPLGSDGEDILVLMELCPGGHLLSRINKMVELGRTLPPERILEVFLSIVRAVTYLHSQVPPIAHRDLKFENVLIAADGALKLCDFGSTSTHSGVVDDRTDRAEQEDAITRFTTPTFRSPEMVDLYSGLPLDVRSDVWALGCMLYGLAYFKHPFQDTGSLAILSGRFKIPYAPAMPEYITTMIRACLSIQPKDRPTSAQLATYIETLQKVSAVHALFPPPPFVLLCAHPLSQHRLRASYASDVCNPMCCVIRVQCPPTGPWPELPLSGGGSMHVMPLPPPAQLAPLSDGSTPLATTYDVVGQMPTETRTSAGGLPSNVAVVAGGVVMGTGTTKVANMVHQPTAAEIAAKIQAVAGSTSAPSSSLQARLARRGAGGAPAAAAGAPPRASVVSPPTAAVSAPVPTPARDPSPAHAASRGARRPSGDASMDDFASTAASAGTDDWASAAFESMSVASKPSTAAKAPNAAAGGATFADFDMFGSPALSGVSAASTASSSVAQMVDMFGNVSVTSPPAPANTASVASLGAPYSMASVHGAPSSVGSLGSPASSAAYDLGDLFGSPTAPASVAPPASSHSHVTSPGGLDDLFSPSASVSSSTHGHGTNALDFTQLYNQSPPAYGMASAGGVPAFRAGGGMPSAGYGSGAGIRHAPAAHASAAHAPAFDSLFAAPAPAPAPAFASASAPAKKDAFADFGMF